MMSTSTLADLFHDTLKDVYWAEKHLLKALPKMAKKATNEELSQAFTEHLAETEGHVKRLEQVFEMIEQPARAKKCEAMVGLSAEGDHVMQEVDDEAVLDAGLVAAAQAVEHYEIARYGALAAWAGVLGHDDAVALLEETLEEEQAADEKLSTLAETLNDMAKHETEAA